MMSHLQRHEFWGEIGKITVVGSFPRVGDSDRLQTVMRVCEGGGGDDAEMKLFCCKFEVSSTASKETGVN